MEEVFNQTATSAYPIFEQVWHMPLGERTAIIGLLAMLKPRCSIEVGTFWGGSLAMLAYYSQQVYTLDIDPVVTERVKAHKNVEFLIGDSSQTLPQLLDRLTLENVPVNFVLIDGDHSSEGVRRDCQQFIQRRPVAEMYIVMHDSFNPDVREGIKTSGWADSPYVHAIELDFVQGERQYKRKMRYGLWGGLALAVLRPEPRQHPLKMRELVHFHYPLLYWTSAHPLQRVKRYLRSKGLA